LLTTLTPAHCNTHRPYRPPVCVLFPASAAHRGPRSVPTRRSSDLDTPIAEVIELTRTHGISGVPVVDGELLVGLVTSRDLRFERSEEHTSELQSRENLVCRLLLEKKKRLCRGKAACITLRR